jgi:KaiC/GvpD/RAD55 family RecA-like ATPase
MSGKIVAVPLPWPTLDVLTQALLPGSVTVVCGDPGAGKTFFVLDCMRAWTGAGHDSAVFFLEKDRKFYTHRLLAQLEGDPRYLDLAPKGWVRGNPAEVSGAMLRNRAVLDDLGGRMTLEGMGQRATLQRIYAWIREELQGGRRLLVVDPITGAHVAGDRWTADDGFMVETQKLLNQYGASLVLVTHPRKGNVATKSGHDMAAGAAYFRFSDTTLWIVKYATPKCLTVASPHGQAAFDASTVIQIHKARMGRGTGQEVAFSFGSGLHYREHGLVIGDAKDDG